MKAPGFRSNPKAYDACKIGGVQVPGEWTCDEFERELKLKNPKGSGDDGGPATITGLKENSEFTISTKLHTDEDEAAWEIFAAKNMPLDNQGKRGAQVMENVQAARLGIRQVIVKKIGESRPLAGGPIVGRVVCRVSGSKSGKSGKAKVKPTGGEDLTRKRTAFDRQTEAGGFTTPMAAIAKTGR